MAVTRVTLHWVDNNGQRAECRFHLNGGVIDAAVEASALSIATAAQAVSSATLTKVDLEVVTVINNPPEPEPGSSVERAALLFYRNGIGTASFRLLAPAGVLFETVGAYAGIRITRQSAALSGLLTALDGLLAGVLDPLGRPYGTTFVVGGRAQ